MSLPKHVDTIVSAYYIAQATLELHLPAASPQNLEYILLPIPDVKEPVEIYAPRRDYGP
jgi:hypothetical protein